MDRPQDFLLRCIFFCVLSNPKSKYPKHSMNTVSVKVCYRNFRKKKGRKVKPKYYYVDCASTGERFSKLELSLGCTLLIKQTIILVACAPRFAHLLKIIITSPPLLLDVRVIITEYLLEMAAESREQGHHTMEHCILFTFIRQGDFSPRGSDIDFKRRG
ncbi:hypothetical protein RRG08_054476 [Elysia crispata]|uniref:Uncharacterized protein n=1 Tax=Elysia crispata TaxID=231223 RepID=A0AAE1CUA3_9GAST|nr:hypothetical protein RRG08_054476 [Elysia crispata]